MKHLTLFGVLACLPIGLVMAHHSINAEYDLEVPVSLDGVITRVEWQSPHIGITLMLLMNKVIPKNGQYLAVRRIC
ncbi:MAG: hypothetical protein CM1200mP36_10860 [Gammaproteobacteria bacterium]|nr:MAG: hypothetical protein CM1200mP36_10860 [Gammaproteobacteria bacterium]